MKNNFLLFCLLAFPSLWLNAQRFTQVTTGTIVTANVSSGGCSWADYNNDGYPDLFVSNITTSNQLFKNNGDGSFQEITFGDIVNDGGISNSAVWGDYDNDGNLDLFVSNNPPANFAPELNFLYKNNGSPNYDFSKIASPPSQSDANYTWSSSWVDYDNDGDLDLHVPDNKHLRKDFFYENDGNGVFTSITPSFVTPDVESTGVVSWIDYDNDGDQDLFMIKSGRTHPSNGENNRFYHNLLMETGQLEFKRVTTAGLVNHFDLDFQASWADYDNDGDFDVYLGNFDNRNYLYRNDGDSLFTQITTGAPVTNNTATLGSSWGDYDNDGDVDLFVLNTSGQRSRYYQNDGNGNFTVLSNVLIGAPLINVSAAQGCAHADYNNDGYLDLYVANSFSLNNARNYLYLNSGGSNRFLEITCKGVVSNAAAIGTKVRIKAVLNGQPVWQLRQISGSPTGNHSQNDLRVHFGVGDATIIDSLIIEWPLGLKETYTAIPSNQFLEFVEGQTTSTGGAAFEEEALKVFPNPLSTETTIQYTLSTQQSIQLEVRDASQKVITTLFQGVQQEGNHEVKLKTENWPPGTYFLVLKNETSIVTKPLIRVH